MYRHFFSKKYKRYLSLTLFGFLWVFQFTSCVDDVDFEQVHLIELNPVYEVDFVYARFDTDVFHQSSSVFVPELIVNDTLDYDLLGIDFATKHLVRVELTFEFENTIQRDFEFHFGFLNVEGERIGPTYHMIADKGNGGGTSPVKTTRQIVMNNVTIDEVETATKLVSSLRLKNVSGTLKGIFELRSKGSYFINYQL